MKWLNGLRFILRNVTAPFPVVMSTVIQIPIPPSICSSASSLHHCSVSLWQEMVFRKLLKLSYFALSYFPNSTCDACSLMVTHPLLPGVMGFSACSSAPHFPAGQFLLPHTTYCPPVGYSPARVIQSRKGLKHTCTGTRVHGNCRLPTLTRCLFPEKALSPPLNAGSALTLPVTQVWHTPVFTERGRVPPPATAPQSPLKFTCESGKQRT